MLMGINGRLSSEGGGALQRGDLRLRQHSGKRLAALRADVVSLETASKAIEAC